MKHVFMKLGACIAVMVIALLPVMPVFSSDISDADFFGVIQTTNNSTAATGVITTITGMNMTALIAGGFVNSTANNCAIQSTTSTDIPFMPGYGTNPTVMYNGSVGQNTITNSLFYTKNVTGGKIVYIPGSTGGTIPDTMTEPGNNCEWTFTDIFLNTDAGASKDILTKYTDATGGYRFSVDPSTSEQLNFDVLTGDYDLQFTAASNQYADKAAGVVAPSGAAMSIDALVYVSALTGNEQTVIACGNAAGTNQFWKLGVNNSLQIVFYIRNVGDTAWAAQWTSTGTLSLTTWYAVTATYDNAAGTRTNVYVNGAAFAGTDVGAGGNIIQPATHMDIGILGNTHNTYPFNGYLDEIRVSSTARTLANNQTFYYGGLFREFTADASTISLWHMENDANPNDTIGNNNLTAGAGAQAPVPVTGTAYVAGRHTYAAVTTGEHDITCGLSGGNLRISMDGTETTTAYAGSIPNNTAVTTLCEGSTVYYVESIEYEQGGAAVDAFEWAYATTFTGNTTGNILTPSFRTTNSDADVSSELILFQPIAEPTAPAFAVGEGPGFFDSSNLTSGNFTTGNVTLEYPLQDLIESVATAGGVPYQIPSTFIASFCVIVLSMLTSFFLKRYSAQSIFLKTIVNTAAYGTLIALHIYDWWMLIFFFIFEASIWFGAQHRRE